MRSTTLNLAHFQVSRRLPIFEQRTPSRAIALLLRTMFLLQRLNGATANPTTFFLFPTLVQEEIPLIRKIQVNLRARMEAKLQHLP